MEYRCGYVAILGKPNAGKSSLVNSLIGEKVAIVSPKPQTTRNNILGILTKSNYQLILIDTPGIHKSKNALDKYMMKNVRSAIGGASVNVYLIDCTREVRDNEIEYLTTLAENNETPVVVALTKIDLIKYEQALPLIAKISQIKGIDEIVPISSKQKKNLSDLLDVVLKFIPETENKDFIYEDDYYTDKSVKFIASEVIREKALLNLEEEIPHGVSVVITKFEEKPKITVIEADINCERESHKSIIIGSKGTMLQQIGEQARLELEEQLDTKILLKLWVRVKKNWRENLNNLSEFGYKQED